MADEKKSVFSDIKTVISESEGEGYARAVEALGEKIEDLETQLEEANEELQSHRRFANWGWTIPQYNWPERYRPVPRLELVWRQVDPGNGRGPSWYNRECTYYLVYQHLLGDIVAVPMGHTTVNGGSDSPPITGGLVTLPFREGAHVVHDAKQLKLPAYACIVGENNELTHITCIVSADGTVQEPWNR